MWTFPFLWVENTEATLRIERFSNGIWNVSIEDQNEEGLHETYLFEDNQFADFSQFGLVFSYTKTRSGKLWMDDVSLRIVPSPIAVKKVEAIAANILQVTYSKPYEINTALDLFNYRLERTDGEQILLRGIEQENDRSILLETGRIDSSSLILSVQGIKDLQGMMMDPQIVDFRYLPPVLPESVVFNELMTDQCTITRFTRI